MTPDEARKWLKETNIKYILAQFVDIHGSAKAKAVPVSHLDDVLTSGAGFAGFAIWGLGMGPHGPDYMAVGDLATLMPIPWMPGYARMACDGHVHGKPYAYDSRVALKNQVDKLRPLGMTLYTGIEPEFMLLKRGPDGTVAPFDAPTRSRSRATTTRDSRAARAFWSGWWNRCRRWASTSTRSITRTRTGSSRSTTRSATA